jgi:RHS repeat-associated protein
MKKILSLLVLFPMMVFAQTQTENYIKTTTYKVAATTSITNPAITQANQNVVYFDGLGRPIQQIAHQQSGSGKDIVTPIDYDGFGRQPIEYLPYVPNVSASLDYKSTALTDVFNFPQYIGQTPYSKKQLEASPLNRVLRQAAPGNDWALDSGHEIKLDYQTNTTTDAVRLFSITANWDVSKGLYEIPTSLSPTDYLEFQLYKNITYDENTAATPTESNGSTVEFKNKEGQVVLKRTYESGVKHDTYYVYDQYGNLTFVIPPLVDANSTIIQTILDGLCYQYKYDYRNRLVEKKLPGKQWEFIVYDKLDRVVATGPAFPPFSDLVKSGWMITKYDVYNRPILTGWMSAATTINSDLRKIHQDERNAQTTNLSESKTDSTPDVTISGITYRYSNLAIPTSGYHVLTVNYYDNYNYPNAPTIPTSIEGQDVYYNTTQKPIGLPTGSWIRAIKTSTSYRNETTYVLYDYKARPLRTFIRNHENSPGGYTQVDSKLDFSGKTLYAITLHKRTNGETPGVTLKDIYTYSDQDRLLTHTHQVNALPVQLLAENSYDELGQLITKNVGNTTTAPLQKVDYAYNIRGWLTGINNDPTDNLVLNTNEKDVFAFKINYNTTAGSVAGVSPLYNGNISETYYRTGSDNVLRKYGYQYDNLNRLKNAIYQKPGGNTYPTYEDYSEKNITYDKNGNIQTLYRNGDLENALPANQIDNLSYTYQANSNKLALVYDSSSNTSGFTDRNLNGDDYTYDSNGNLIIDKNKGITAIIYNHLNLPIKITFGTNGTIEYLYNANGKKLEKLVTQGTVITTTKYLEGFQYINDVLNYFPTAEGYVSKTGSSYKYVFNYTDHLGNIRLSYSKNATTGLLEIQEENNYYPFGLKHKGYNSNNAQPDYKYKYNGKELEDELGKNTYAFGWRDYDPAIGRFTKIDRFAEKYHKLTPYGYAGNNPVLINDIQGDSLWISFGRGNANRALYQDGQLLNSDGSRYEGAGVKVRKDGSVKIKDSFLSKTVAALDKASSKSAGNDLIDGIQSSTDNVNVVQSNSGNSYNPGTNTVSFDPSSKDGGLNAQGNTSRPTFIGLGHELAHSLDDISGTLNTSTIPGQNFAEAEKYATHIENQMRAEHRISLRTHYSYSVDPNTGAKTGVFPLLNSSMRSVYYPNFQYGGINSNLQPAGVVQSPAQILPSITIIR